MSINQSLVRRPFHLSQTRPARHISVTCAAGKQQQQQKKQSKGVQENTPSDCTAALLGSAGLLTPLLLDVQTALAQKGEYGIVEGRIASLTHPVLMGFLFGASVYTGWLGFQWRYVSASQGRFYCRMSGLVRLF